MKPAFSVVIPSFNHAPYLRACLDSVLEQTYPPSEVIVVDDGSTDESVEILQSYEPRIKLTVQENRGTYATLNVAIAESTGDWIAIQNSDDVWAPRKLEKQAVFIQDHPDVGLVFSDYAVIDAGARALSKQSFGLPDYHGPSIPDLLPTLLENMPIIISSATFSRSAWKRVGPFDERYHGCGDWDFCLRLSAEFPIGFVDEPLAMHRKHAANASHDPTRIPKDWGQIDWRLLASETIPKVARQLVERAHRGQVPRRQAAFILACLGMRYIMDSQNSRARSMLGLSARLDPLRFKTHLRYLTTFFPPPLSSRLR